jgi:hypothetical protein
MKMPREWGRFHIRPCGAMCMSSPTALSWPVNGVDYHKGVSHTLDGMRVIQVFSQSWQETDRLQLRAR